MCKYLTFKGAQSNCNVYFSFEGPRAPQLHWFLVLHSPFGESKLSLGHKWWRDWILGRCDSWILSPCDSVPPPIGGMECGWYGSAPTWSHYGSQCHPHCVPYVSRSSHFWTNKAIQMVFKWFAEIFKEHFVWNCYSKHFSFWITSSAVIINVLHSTFPPPTNVHPEINSCVAQATKSTGGLTVCASGSQSFQNYDFRQKR